MDGIVLADHFLACSSYWPQRRKAHLVGTGHMTRSHKRCLSKLLGPIRATSKNAWLIQVSNTTAFCILLHTVLLHLHFKCDKLHLRPLSWERVKSREYMVVLQCFYTQEEKPRCANGLSFLVMRSNITCGHTAAEPLSGFKCPKRVWLKINKETSIALFRNCYSGIRLRKRPTLCIDIQKYLFILFVYV